MKQIRLIIAIILVSSGHVSGKSKGENKDIPLLDISGFKQIAEIDRRYQSVNVEMCEVVGGNFWIPYDLLDSEKVNVSGLSALKREISPINLYDKKLRVLASALGPMYVRISGTWANSTYFQDNDEPKLESAPEGYENVLTRAEWKGVVDFCKAIDAKLVTSFAISPGMRDAEGNWTKKQIEPLINYTKSIGGEIAAAEMFNEPSHAGYGSAPNGYDASWFARDFAAFKSFVDSAVPEMKMLGPGSTGEGGIIPSNSILTDDIFKTKPKPGFEIFSYHYYGGVSQRCGGKLTPETALSKDWLQKTEEGLKYYVEARDNYLPGTPIWLTETAEAACGGNPWAATYVDCFRYLEQLGRLAKKGIQVVMHNTLCASEYSLLEQETYEPKPNYWAALLWNSLMGTKVYETHHSLQGVDVFIHNLKDSGVGYSILIINSESFASSIQIPVEARQYLLESETEDIQSKSVKLNGEKLTLRSDESLPVLKSRKLKPGVIQLPPYSISFFVIDQVDKTGNSGVVRK
jgi:hypothetical protein